MLRIAQSDLMGSAAGAMAYVASSAVVALVRSYYLCVSDQLTIFSPCRRLHGRVVPVHRLWQEQAASTQFEHPRYSPPWWR